MYILLLSLLLGIYSCYLWHSVFNFFISFVINIRLLIDIIIILIVQFYYFIIDIVQVVLFYFILIVIIWCYIILIVLLLISFSIVLCLNYFKFVLKVSIHNKVISLVVVSDNFINHDLIIHGYVFVPICTWSIFFLLNSYLF